MSIRHHVSDDLLVSYAAGSLSEGWSLLVATHLALCPRCRSRNRSAEAIGGWMLDCAGAEPVATGSLASVMARITDANPLQSQQRGCAESTPCSHDLPEPLRGYAGGELAELGWRRVGFTAARVEIKTGDPETQVRLLRFPPGMEVPEHGHGGRELTLILFGSLHDGGCVFERGDVADVDETVEHTPKAGPETGCVCLAVTNSPLRFRSLALRLVRPILGI
ncbi:ChrR family anti-sigma-E factor [Methylocapsa palsarum]|uniref:Putative transcriptional regulator n=1 Tax=Methylocapsa palsarum TaxID=1612308 RepID=A0A1I3VSJ9_9HYPH|nr:ChrR family anti-sigma-E factor [Methylocapsa palsarum]SFJ98205.1 putative transcriptional regulator [Methylocapsa palsarum]